MKRAQIVERNRGHWDFEVEHPIAPPELEQGPMPRNFGVTTRRLRFTRSLSRNDRECINDTHEDSGAVVGTSERVLRSSQTRVSTSVISAREGSKSSLEIFNDHISEIVVNAGSQVDESGQDCLSPELPKATLGIDSGKAQQGIGEDDRGKENVDPLGGTSSGSPLPEWFTRRPLQDITNVLGLGEDQQPQPKKKLKKKAGTAAVPSFPSISETPTRRKDSTVIQPKCYSFATPKQYSNLGKNFR
ncbi:hypothetical protein M758_1G137200 [Ceratodon purpureus]|nr:hypothetical protein M758_1G137200 [Ceratodon purpureus]